MRRAFAAASRRASSSFASTSRARTFSASTNALDDARARSTTPGRARSAPPFLVKNLPPTNVCGDIADDERLTGPPRARTLRQTLSRAVVRDHGVRRARALGKGAARGAAKVAETLRRRAEGADVYVVGGAVRDWIARGDGTVPRDVDLATSATYNEARAALGRRMKTVGRRFTVGLVRADDGEWIELASFESDDGGKAGGVRVDDGRRASEGGEAPRKPCGELDLDEILRRRRESRGGETRRDDEKRAIGRRRGAAAAPATARADADFHRLLACADNAQRRDFTVNAMYYDPFREEVLDFCNGINDAIEGVVRTVRPTHASLKEDPVRMLRAIRLAARHGFTMTKGLRAGLRAYAPTLALASSRRVAQEIETLMHHGYATRTFKLLWHSTILKYAFPVQFEFLRQRLPKKSTLTYEMESLVTPERDVDGGARTFFDALEAYDACVRHDADCEHRIAEPAFAQWLAVVVAPVALEKLRDADADAECADADAWTPPPRWDTVRDDPVARERAEARWHAFTFAALDVLDDMLERSAMDAPRDGDDLALLTRADCASALLLLLAHGPIFADAQRGHLRWLDADLERLSDGGARVRASFARARRRGEWHNANKSPSAADADAVRACLEKASAVTKHITRATTVT